jgi:hypothetical protein
MLPLYQAKITLLQSVPRVGPITALTLVAALPELGQLSRRESATLYMAAFAGVRWNPMLCFGYPDAATGEAVLVPTRRGLGLCGNCGV